MPHPKIKIADNSGNEVGVTNNRLDVNATLGVGSSAFTTYAQADSATTAATITSLISGSAVTTCKEIIIQADFDNAGYIMIGDDAVAADTEGIRLQAGDMLILAVSDTDNVSVRALDTNQKFNISIIT